MSSSSQKQSSFIQHNCKNNLTNALPLHSFWSRDLHFHVQRPISVCLVLRELMLRFSKACCFQEKIQHHQQWDLSVCQDFEGDLKFWLSCLDLISSSSVSFFLWMCRENVCKRHADVSWDTCSACLRSKALIVLTFTSHSWPLSRWSFHDSCRNIQSNSSKICFSISSSFTVDLTSSQDHHHTCSLVIGLFLSCRDKRRSRMTKRFLQKRPIAINQRKQHVHSELHCQLFLSFFSTILMQTWKTQHICMQSSLLMISAFSFPF